MGRFSYLTEFAAPEPESTTDGASTDGRKLISDKPTSISGPAAIPSLMVNYLTRGRTGNQFADELANTVTLGASGAIGRRIGAGMASAVDDTLGYEEALELMGKTNEKGRDDEPALSILGMLFGGLAGGGAAGSALSATKAAVPLLATRSGVGPAAARIGAAAGAGGTANMAAEAGMLGTENTASLMDFILGAAGGGVGQALGETIPPVVRGAKRLLHRSSPDEVADQTFDAMIKPSGKGPRAQNVASMLDVPPGHAITGGDWEDLADAVPPSGVLGEATDDLTSLTTILAGSRGAADATSGLKHLAQQRVDQAPQTAEILIERSFAPSSTRAQSFKQFRDTRKALNEQFTAAMETAEGRGEFLEQDDVAAAVLAAFGDRPAVGRMKELQDKALRLIDDATDENILLPSSLQEIKGELDAVIHSYGPSAPGAIEAPGLERLRSLSTKMKNNIDELLLGLAPELKDVKGAMRENFASQQAMSTGFDLMRVTKTDPEQIKAAYDALSSPAQKTAFEMGMLQSIAEDALNKGEGGIGLLKKVFKGPTKEMSRLRAVLPENTIKEFEERATLMVQELQNANKFLPAIQRGKEAAIQGADPVNSTVLDLGTIMRPLMGQGGTTQGVVGARRIASHPDVLLQQNLMDLLSLPGPAAKRAIKELEEGYLKKRAAGGFKSGAAGATAGSTVLDRATGG